MERPLMDEEGNGFLTGCQAVTEEYPCAREGTFLKLLFRNNFQLYVLQLFLRASSPVIDVRLLRYFPAIDTMSHARYYFGMTVDEPYIV